LLGLATSAADTRLLFVTRAVRLFAFGFLSVILVQYLIELGLGYRAIGFLLTMTLLGDTAISLWMTTRADRVGRKTMLIAGAILMAAGGLVFAFTDSFFWLLLAATIGVLSPSANEVGPFLAIEQAALAQTVDGSRRTQIFARYHLVGYLATACGALACGLVDRALLEQSVPVVQRYRVILMGYAAAGVLLAVLFTFVSRAVEVSESNSPRRTGSGSNRSLSAASRAVEVSNSNSLREASSPRGTRLGLHRSFGVVMRLSGLFALDAFAGGFVPQSIVAGWFALRFQPDPVTLGGIFFGANLLSAVSALGASWLARRYGLINTMVFTHVPANLFLILLPFMPTLSGAIVVLFIRSAISQMDVPARQSYTIAVVNPDERSAAAGVTGVARTTGAALSPVLAGLLLADPALTAGPFVAAGLLKLLYDGLLYRLFRHAHPPEERAREASPRKASA
jgi:MFS family permease